MVSKYIKDSNNRCKRRWSVKDPITKHIKINPSDGLYHGGLDGAYAARPHIEEVAKHICAVAQCQPVLFGDRVQSGEELRESGSAGDRN